MAILNDWRFNRDEPHERVNHGLYFPGCLAHIQYLLDNRIGWAEVSGDLERYFCRIGTINNVINPALLMNHNVVRNIEIDDDGYHYNRSVEGEKKSVKMIAYGHIEFE